MPRHPQPTRGSLAHPQVADAGFRRRRKRTHARCMHNPRLDALAHDQDGLITRRQALAAGASADAIRHQLGAGRRWQVVVPGIYATFTGPLAEIHRLRAAVLHAGDGAVITGVAACRMTGLRYVPHDPVDVDVLVHRRRHPLDVGFIRVHRTARLPDAVSWMDTCSPGAVEDQERARPWWLSGDELAPSARRWILPIAPIQRSAIDAARGLSQASAENRQEHRRVLRDVRALLCEVVQRRRCTVADLRTELEAAARAGTAPARVAIGDIEVGCRSAPECEFRDLVRSSRLLPEPLWNQPLPGCGFLHPDACWPEARLVVEVNSWEWHGYGNAPEETERRHALYASLGWTVLPISPYRLRTERSAVLCEVVAAYCAGLTR